MTAVGNVVTAGNHRSTVSPGSVRVLEREAGKCVTASISERVLNIACAYPIVGGSIEGSIVGQPCILVDFEIKFAAQIVLLEYVRVDLYHTGLTVITAGDVVLHILVASADGNGMGGDRVPVIVEFVIPVGIAVVNPLVAALAEILHYPRTCRILGHIVDAGEELNHILVSIGGVLGTAIGHPELVHGVG